MVTSPGISWAATFVHKLTSNAAATTTRAPPRKRFRSFRTTGSDRVYWRRKTLIQRIPFRVEGERDETDAQSRDWCRTGRPVGRARHQPASAREGSDRSDQRQSHGAEVRSRSVLAQA